VFAVTGLGMLRLENFCLALRFLLGSSSTGCGGSGKRCDEDCVKTKLQARFERSLTLWNGLLR
jgi:hypothetical protein